MKLFFSIKFAPLIALAIAASGSAQPQKMGAHPATKDVGRPGQYRLLESNDDAVCRSFATLFATSRSKEGDLDFSDRRDKVLWQDLSPRLLDPPTQFADFDIDNDGRTERVFRVAWSLASNYTYALYIQRNADLSAPPSSDRETVLAIIRTAPKIEFMEYASLIARLQKQYGNNWEAWWMYGHVFIEAIKASGNTYLIAWRYGIKPRGLANAYVFQVRPDGSMSDTCMFARICACPSCWGTESIVEQRLAPHRNYCRRPSVTKNVH